MTNHTSRRLALSLLIGGIATGCSSTGSQRLSSIDRSAPHPVATHPAPQTETTERAATTQTSPEPEVASQPASSLAQTTPQLTTQSDRRVAQPQTDLLENARNQNPEPIQSIAAAPTRSPSPTKSTPGVQRNLVRERSIEILEHAAFAEHPLLRANAIEALQSAPMRLTPFVREALSDTNPGVRFVAAMSVGKLRLAEFTPESIDLQQDADPRVRAAALYAQARNGFSPNLTPIADLLFSDDPAVRSQAAYILGELGNESALPMLRSVATKHATGMMVQDRIFRLQLAEAMVKLGDADAVQTIHVALYPALRDDFEGAVLAAQILGEIKDRQAIQQLVNVVEARIPEQAKTSRNTRNKAQDKMYLYPPELRLAAATSLAKMGYPDGVYVADEYATHEDQMVRAQSAFLYAQARRAGDLPRLDALMGDPSPLVRTAAASGVLTYLAPESR